MRVSAWLRRPGRPSSPPESNSSAGRRSGPDTSSSLDPASARGVAASARSAVRRLRPVLAAALLALPLLGTLAPEAAAQTAVECTTANTDGTYTVPTDWALKPSGLAAGTKFRLLFITSTARTGVPTDIATYNTFVQTAAKAGHSAISDSCGNLFKVVGSTSAVDARDNTATTGTGEAIYWLNGNKLADNYGDFYDGSWDDYGKRDESGTAITSNLEVTTGSNQNGTKHATGYLGAVLIAVGHPQSGSNPVFQAISRLNLLTQIFYGLSPVFKVGSQASLPVITIEHRTGTPTTVTEGATLEFTINLSSAAPPSGLDVNLSYSNPTGANFFSGGTGGTFRIAAGETSLALRTTVITTNDSTDEPSGDVTVTVASGTGYTIGSPASATVRVEDDDATTVTLDGDADPVLEGEKKHFTLSLGRRLYGGEALEVPLTFTSGSGVATRGTDYTLVCSRDPNVSCANLNSGSAAATFTGSATGSNFSITLTLSAIYDGVDDDGETVDIGLGTLNPTNLDGGTSKTDSAPQFTITNQALGPGEFNVNFDDISFPAREAAGVAEVTGTLSPAPEEDGTLRFRYSDLTATLNADYRAVYALDYRAGQTAFVLRIPLVEDGLIEEGELLRIHALDPQTGDPGSSTDVIVENSDLPIVSGSPSAAAGDPVRVLVRFATGRVQPKGPLVIRVETVEGSGAGAATEGTDYTAVDTQVTIPQGVPFAWVEIPTAADADTGPETFGLRFSLVSYTGQPGGVTAGSWPAGSEREITATIVPAGSPVPGWPAVAIEAEPAEVIEGGAAEFTLTARPKPANDLMVSVLLVPSGDFLADEHRGRELAATIDAATGTGTLIVPTLEAPGNRDGTIVADVIPRQFSKIAAVMNSPPYRTAGVDAKPRATLRVTDHPDVLRSVLPEAPTLTLAADAASVTEGGAVSFTITADRAPQQDIEVAVSAEERMGAGSRSVATGRVETVWLRAGQASVKWSFTAYSDDDERADGTVEARIVPDRQGFYKVGDPSSVTMALIDDDGTGAVPADNAQPQMLPPAGLSLPGTAAAGLSNGVVTVARPSGWTGPGKIQFGGGPAKTQDRGSFTTLRIANVGADSFEVRWASRDAGTQHLTLEWQPVAGSSWQPSDGDARDPRVLTVEDPAPAQQAAIEPSVTIAAGAAPVTEGADAVFTLTANPAPTTPLAVTVTVAADGDYGIVGGTQVVTIPTGGSTTLTLPTTDDAADEPDGSATVTVKDGTGYSVGSPASGTVAIEDDDLPPPVVSIAAKTAAITEGGDAVFTLTADRAPGADLPVNIAVSETGDHVAAQHEGARTATIARGTTAAEIAVPTVDDSADEPDGTVTATLKGGNGYTLAGASSASVSVADNDASSLATLSIDDATAREGETMQFAVRLSAPSKSAVWARLETLESNPVSARAVYDFRNVRSGEVMFLPGQTVVQFGVYLYDDSHDDGGETFEVHVLSASEGVSIADGVAVGTIENDDPLPAAWLKRFGRTVAQQALDGIADRIAAPREAGMQGTLAGQTLSFDPTAGDAAGPDNAQSGANGKAALAMAGIARGFDRSAQRSNAADPFGSGGPSGFGAPPGQSLATQSRTMTAHEALLGSSFSLTGAKDGAGGSLAFWGRASQGSFDGTERGDGTDIRLDGTATTGMLGADYARGKWLLGLALAQSDAEGDYVLFRT